MDIGAAPSRALMEILHALPVGVEIYDNEFNALFYNTAADDLFLYRERVIVQHDEWWDLGFPDPVARAQVIADWQSHVAATRCNPHKVQQGEWNVRCRDGLQHMVQYRLRPMGSIFVLVLLDVTERRHLEAELRRLAAIDPLTGVFNRRRFVDEAEAAFHASHAHGGPLALLMLDIDHFKAVNDRYGHGIGDEVIRTVARRCQSAVRSGDVLARIGGEEFAILMPGASVTQAQDVGQGLLRAVGEQPFLVGGLVIPVGISVGGTCLNGEDPHMDAVLSRADRALYGAKRGGRGRMVFDPAS